VVDLEYFRALVIAFGMFVGAGLGLPFPEEILIVGAGIWTAANPEYGPLRWVMLPVCIVGVLIADVLLYGFGRYFGPRLLSRPWVRKMLPPGKQARIEDNYHHYGVSILLFGRLVPGIRVPLFLTAGIMRLAVPRFLVADGLGAVLGNGLLYFLAFWFGDAVMDVVKQAERQVHHYQQYLIMAAVLLVAAYLLYRFLRRPVPEGDITKEVPLIGPTIAAHISGDTKELPPVGQKATATIDGEAPAPPAALAEEAPREVHNRQSENV
jgi:membrane protein DedA with SNARE-associated domain